MHFIFGHRRISSIESSLFVKKSCGQAPQLNGCVGSILRNKYLQKMLFPFNSYENLFVNKFSTLSN